MYSVECPISTNVLKSAVNTSTIMSIFCTVTSSENTIVIPVL